MTEAKACKCLSELEESYKNFDVIGIDEGQFFKDVINFQIKSFTGSHIQ